jgi:hypothetical protein
LIVRNKIPCDPMENRTPVTGMRTRCPNRWTMGPD